MLRIVNRKMVLLGGIRNCAKKKKKFFFFLKRRGYKNLIPQPDSLNDRLNCRFISIKPEISDYNCKFLIIFRNMVVLFKDYSRFLTLFSGCDTWITEDLWYIDTYIMVKYKTNFKIFIHSVLKNAATILQTVNKL